MLGFYSKNTYNLLFRFHTHCHIFLWMLNYSLVEDVDVLEIYKFAT
jgi:hypothetical protein